MAKKEFHGKQRDWSVEELQEKWRCEQAGLPWPPVERAVEALDNMAKKDEEILKLRTEIDRVRKQKGAIRLALAEMFERYGIDPAEELIKIATETVNGPGGTPVLVCDKQERISIWRDLLQYRYPKLKAMEVAGKVDHNLNVTILRFSGEGGGEPVAINRTPTVDVDAEISREIREASDE